MTVCLVEFGTHSFNAISTIFLKESKANFLNRCYSSLQYKYNWRPMCLHFVHVTWVPLGDFNGLSIFIYDLCFKFNKVLKPFAEARKGLSIYLSRNTQKFKNFLMTKVGKIKKRLIFAIKGPLDDKNRLFLLYNKFRTLWSQNNDGDKKWSGKGDPDTK